MGSKIFHNDISGLINDQSNRQDNDKLSKNELLQIQEQCKDIPEQVVSMIKSGREFLQTLDIHVDDKIIVEGYSAGTKFANCYTELHPEIVKACICGGNSGLGIIPLP